MEFFLVGRCTQGVRLTEIDIIYYKEPTTDMNVLVDDKGALDIADLCRVYLSVGIYIQHTLYWSEYYEGPIDDVKDVNHEDILNIEEEDQIAKLYEQVIKGDSELNDGKLNVDEDKHGNVNVDDGKHGSVNVDEGKYGNVNVGQGQHVNVNVEDGQHDDMQAGGKGTKKWNVGVNKTKAIKAGFATRDMVLE